MVDGVRAGVIAPRTPPRLLSGRPSSLRQALGVVCLCSLLLGILQLAVVIEVRGTVYGIVIFTAVFWIWIMAGVIAWWRRPSNTTGALIVLGGLTVFVGGLINLDMPLLGVLSTVFATSVLAVAVHLLHAFPSGRLHGRLSTVTVAVGYIVSVGAQAAFTVLRMYDSNLVPAVRLGQSVLGVTVMVLTAIILIHRLRAADRDHRKILLPLSLYGSLAVLLIPVGPLLLAPLGVSPVVTGSIQLVLSAGLPIAFMLGVLGGGFSRTGELDALSAWLGLTGATRSAVARALAVTLGDESLRVIYWAGDPPAFVDEFGVPVQIEVADKNRVKLDVRVESRLVGAIIYDARLIADTDVVRRVGEVLAIAIDRERLTTELLSSNEALLQSRLRLVEAADRERTRIAQDLHDGLQVQLVLLALEAQQIGSTLRATNATHLAAIHLRRGIDDAAADLRRFVHNVMPAALFERGLSAAAEDMVDRLAIPAALEVQLGRDQIDPAITHTAYFVIAEALSNAVKHSSAVTVQVRIIQSIDRLLIEVADDGVGGASFDEGTGLKGLTDRVDALGGILTLKSPTGQGTLVKVDLPCVS